MKKTPYESLADTLALIHSGKLSAHPSFMLTPVDELLEICNGCGSSKAKIDFVPDTVWFLSIKAACHVHDFGYHVGRTIEDKNKEDRRMLNNIIRLVNLRSGWLLKKLRLLRARTYYNMVRLFGGPYFWGDRLND